MPIDLAANAVMATRGRGWLGGWKGDRELVFLVTAAEFDDEVEYSKTLRRLLRHRLRVTGEHDDHRLPFVTMKAGFTRQLQTGRITAAGDLVGWSREALPEDEILQGQMYLCCIEAGPEGPIVSFVVVFPRSPGDGRSLFALEVEMVSDVPGTPTRLDGLLPLAELRSKRVAVVGLGSGGGFLALELAAAGVGELELFDRDRLRLGNLFRHVCGLADLGREKVRAVADLIRDHDLITEVVTHFEDVLESPDNLRAVIPEVDAVVCATDGSVSRRLLNYVCVKAGRPLIMAATFDNAKIGEVVRVLPGRTACYECSRMELAAGGCLIPEDDDPGDHPYSAQSSAEESLASRGIRADVFSVAALAAKVTLMTLLDDRPEVFGHLPQNYLVWGAMRNTRFGPPFSFKYPFTAGFVELNRRLDCPVCGQLPSELLGVDIDDSYSTVLPPYQQTGNQS